MPLESSDVVKQCKRVVGKLAPNGYWIERDSKNLIDFADNHIPIPFGHLGITCDLAFAVVVGQELKKNATVEQINAAIDGYAAVLMARTRDSEYEAQHECPFRSAPEWSDCTALSTVLDATFAKDIQSSAAWYAVDDQRVQSIPVKSIPESLPSLVWEALQKTHLGPGDLVLYALEGSHYCQAGNTIELGLENYFRSEFTVEKASEVTAILRDDPQKHPKVCQHVVDELIP